MFIRKLIAGATLGLALTTAQATTVSINFDDGAQDAAVGATYAALGITFVDAQFSTNFGLAGSSGALGIASISSMFIPQQSNPISAVFASAINAFSLTGVDVGEGGFIMTAYDAVTGGNIVATTQVFGTGLGSDQFFTLQLSGNNIFRVDFSQAAASATDGLVFDNLTFNTATVPEPAPLALIGLGLAALAMRRRTMAKQA